MQYITLYIYLQIWVHLDTILDTYGIFVIVKNVKGFTMGVRENFDQKV